jgi:hypothetical protein
MANKMHEIVQLMKRMITRDGGLEPTILIEGSKGAETRPLPDLPAQAKRALLEAVGYTLAVEDRIGDLVHLSFVAEG